MFYNKIIKAGHIKTYNVANNVFEFKVRKYQLGYIRNKLVQNLTKAELYIKHV